MNECARWEWGACSHERPCPFDETPVQRAAVDLRVNLDEKGTTVIADDEDVARIADAVAEHRKGLMERLAD